MKNKDLIAILEALPDDAEISVTIKDVLSGNILAETYDVDYVLNENSGLGFVVAIETEAIQ